MPDSSDDQTENLAPTVDSSQRVRQRPGWVLMLGSHDSPRYTSGISTLALSNDGGISIFLATWILTRPSCLISWSPCGAGNMTKKRKRTCFVQRPLSLRKCSPSFFVTGVCTRKLSRKLTKAWSSSPPKRSSGKGTFQDGVFQSYPYMKASSSVSRHADIVNPSVLCPHAAIPAGV